MKHNQGWAHLTGLVILTGMFFGTGTMSAATFCVSTTGELQTALTTAATNGQHDTIQLVQGSYGSQSWYSSGEAFNLTLEGGYSAGCGFRIVNPANTVLDGGGNNFVLALTATVRANFTLDGLTLQNGKPGSRNGGGLYISTVLGGNVTLTNDVFSNNSVGGYYGGGAYLYGPSGNGGSVTLSGCTFVGNTASRGGGVHVGGFTGTITLTGNTFTDNHSTSSDGGGFYGTGIGVINATGNLWQDNTAYNLGGGASVSCASGTWPGNQFHGNSAGYGGGVSIYSTGTGNTILLTGNTFDNNSASTQGGGLYVNWNGTFQLTSNLLYGNTSTSGHGAGIYVSTVSTLNLTGNTIADNTASTNGGGLWVQLLQDTNRADLLHNIFWANSAAAGDDLWINNDANGNFIPSTVTFEFNDFDQSAAGSYLNLSFGFSATNFNKVDPLFVDQDHPTSPDFHLQSLAGSYHGGSWLIDPCHSSLIDAGNPSSPYSSEPAPNGGRVDLGAYGNTTQASLSIFPATAPPCIPYVPPATGFYPLTPCRVFDTRDVSGAPILEPNSSRTFTVADICGIPTDAEAISGNVTVVNGAATGDLCIIAGNYFATMTTILPVPLTRGRANNAMIQLATDGTGTIKALNKSAGTVHLILDVNGYFK